MEEQPDYSYVLDLISQCEDVNKLATFVMNAQKRNASIVREAAYNRLKSFIPKSIIKGIDQDFWTMFSAHEDLLLERARPMTKLNSARELMLNEGAVSALDFWVKHKSQAWAFNYFMFNNRQTLTAENLVIEYSEHFSDDVYEMAQSRLYLAKRKVPEIA